MKKLFYLFIVFVAFNPSLFSQNRRLDIICNFGIVCDEYYSDLSNKTTTLIPEIRIGYEFIKNWMFSINYGYWNNNIQNTADTDYMDVTLYNHADNLSGVIINPINKNKFNITPFLGYSIHILKSSLISPGWFMINKYYKQKTYSCIDFGIRIGYKIDNSLGFHLEFQGSYFTDNRNANLLKFIKSGISINR